MNTPVTMLPTDAAGHAEDAGEFPLKLCCTSDYGAHRLLLICSKESGTFEKFSPTGVLWLRQKSSHLHACVCLHTRRRDLDKSGGWRAVLMGTSMGLGLGEQKERGSGFVGRLPC